MKLAALFALLPILAQTGVQAAPFGIGIPGLVTLSVADPAAVTTQAASTPSLPVAIQLGGAGAPAYLSIALPNLNPGVVTVASVLAPAASAANSANGALNSAASAAAKPVVSAVSAANAAGSAAASAAASNANAAASVLA